MKMKRQSLPGALSMALALYARSLDGKATLNTVVLQVTAGIQMTTTTPLLIVQGAYNADAEIMGLMPMFHRAVALVVNRYLTEQETVEFHMYLADPQGLILSLAPLFLKRNKSRRLSTRPLKESFPKGDLGESLKQSRRLLLFQNPFAVQTQLTENEEHGKRKQLDQLIQTTGQISMSTER